MLRVDNIIIRVDDGFERTTKDWSYDHERIQRVTEHRWAELARIQEFVRTDDCLTKFIDDELDGSLEDDCGRCANCTGPDLPTDVQDEELVQAAIEHYRAESWDEISPRFFLPTKDGKSKIAEQRKPEPGRVLSVYGDPGYGELVSSIQEKDDRYGQELVTAAVEHIVNVWEPDPTPTWVTPVPSPTNTRKVRDLARRIAAELGLEYVQALRRTGEMRPQHELANAYQKRWNVKGVFEATDDVRDQPVLLVDDTVGSRWTFTEATFELRDAGSGPVYPFALAERKRW